MTKGVILVAYGKQQYILMAAQLMASLKFYSPDIPICLVHDWNIKYLPQRYYQFIDKRLDLDHELSHTNEMIDPGKAKCNISKYLAYDENIFFDVDGLCMAPIDDLFGQKKDFAIEVIDQGGKNDSIDYNHWAEQSVSWDYFGLNEKSVFPAVQTSFMFMRKSATVENLQILLTKYHDFPVKKLKNTWGKFVPDELIYSGCLAKMGYDAKINRKVVFFGHKYYEESFKEIKSEHCILSAYGNGGPNSLVKLRYLDWYDIMNIKIHKALGIDRVAPIKRLMNAKHAVS